MGLTPLRYFRRARFDGEEYALGAGAAVYGTGCYRTDCGRFTIFDRRIPEAGSRRQWFVEGCVPRWTEWAVDVGLDATAFPTRRAAVEALGAVLEAERPEGV